MKFTQICIKFQKVRDAMDHAIVAVEEKMDHQAAVNEKKASVSRWHT